MEELSRAPESASAGEMEELSCATEIASAGEISSGKSPAPATSAVSARTCPDAAICATAR